MCFPGAVSHVSVNPASIRSSEMFRPVKSRVPRLFVRIEFRFQYFHGQPVQTAASPCPQVIDPQRSFARTLFGFAIAWKVPVVLRKPTGRDGNPKFSLLVPNADASGPATNRRRRKQLDC